jgi:methylmalonyl-CoA mutase
MDPAHGAWFIEKMTDELAHKSWTLFQEIEAKGGMGAALESGFIQSEIAKTAEARANNVATGRQELTGVSTFPRLADDGVKVAPFPPSEPVVRGGTSVSAMPPRRLAEPFELLRDASDAHLAATGKRPQVFLACLGDLAVYSARATWTRNFLAAGGIEAVGGESLHNSADAGKVFAESGAALACICSSDAVYAEVGEATAGALKAAGAAQVLLAGRPRPQEAALQAAGVDTFIFAGSNALATLARIYDALGIRYSLRL